MQMTMIAPDCSTFSGVLGDWLGAETQGVKPSSHCAYQTVTAAHILPELGGVPPTELTQQQLTDFLHRKSGALAPSTVRIIAAVLRGALHYAEETGVLAPGCAAAVTKLATPKRREARSLSATEQAALETVLRQPDAKRLGVLLTLYTGLRVGELCALQWRDISAGAQTLSVRRTVQRIRRATPSGARTELHFDTPKTQSSARTIPIPAKIAALLEPLRADPDCFVLSGTPDVVEPRTMQNRFKAYLREAGVEDINFHALRHTFATRWMERGFDVKALSRILGHADVATTLNIYVHPSMDTMRGYMDQL